MASEVIVPSTEANFGDLSFMGLTRHYFDSDCEVAFAHAKLHAKYLDVSKAAETASDDDQAPKDNNSANSTNDYFASSTSDSNGVLLAYAQLYNGGNGVSVSSLSALSSLSSVASVTSPTSAQVPTTEATAASIAAEANGGSVAAESFKEAVAINGNAASMISSPVSPKATSQRYHEKSASEEVLEMCHRQGISAQLTSATSLQESLGKEPLAYVGAGPGSTDAAAAVPVAPMMLDQDAFLNQADGIMGPAVVYASTAPPTERTAAHGEKAAMPASAAYPSIVIPSVNQQLEAASAERARLAVALKSAQNACARKDEQILDLQRRDGMLVQQYLQLQSMYQGTLDQMQREQQQWAHNSAQLQGELRTKQNVEELTKLLTNQLRQEQRQRKQTMVQLQAEAAARQQAQDQLSATRSQLQQLQTNADSLQWLQSTKAKLQAELNNSNTHLQMERQRRSEATLQLQSALADKQRVKDELDALRMQLQQHGLQSSSVESSSAMVQGQLGGNTPTYVQPSPFFSTFQEQQQQEATAPAQRLQHYSSLLEPAQLDTQQYNSRTAPASSTASPISFMMRPAASMGMQMQDPVVSMGYTAMGMRALQPF